jgi:hypothetical protein
MLDEMIHDLPGRNHELTRYIDGFDPHGIVSLARLRTAGSEVIPPLLAALAEQRLSAYLSHDLNCVASVHECSGGGMRLVKANDPRFHPTTSTADTSVLVLVRDGAFVGCMASRLIWCEATLAEEMESGHFWVSDPATMWSSADRCIVYARSAAQICACPVVYTGSVYLDPSVRGGTTLAAMCRLHLLWLLAHWRWSWIVGLIESDRIHRYGFDIYGIELIEQGVWRTREGDNELHAYQLTLQRREVAMESWLRPEMGDLTRPMGRPPRSVLPREALEHTQRKPTSGGR